MRQAQDFYDESDALHSLIAPLSDAEYDMPTLFKGWTINMILRHLHVWNIAADLALTQPVAFAEFIANMASGIRGGLLPEFEVKYLDGVAGQNLASEWIHQFTKMAPHFSDADPKLRVKWVGPDMSVMSSITARLMETWAHGQAIYDVLGVERIDADRIGNIVRLGVNTYGWTWKNRRMEPPGPMPHLCLTAPSGAIWEYGEPSENGLIEGSASEFCQVVTQTRNIADTALRVTGGVATQWMAVSQCFAGPPQDPPAKGVRHRD
jgi:uncharacterized protein (TIGR03084 family)